jgi:hypothetical protein
MRFASLLVGALALGFASAASAQTIQPVSYSDDFAEQLQDDLGPREGAHLSEALTRYVAEALEARGLSQRDVTIELSIIDAKPNRPTFEQAANRPGLDIFRSISVGGAELSGVVRNSSGDTIKTVEHRYYSHDLWDARHRADTWGDARRAMRRFAAKVADAVAAS